MYYLNLKEEVTNLQRFTRGKLGFKTGKDAEVSDEDERDDRCFSNN